MMGMSDLQFKSYIKHLLARLETAKEKETQEQTRTELEELMRDLREDLQG